MTVTVKTIIQAKQAEAAQTVQYTANLCKTVIDKFTVGNTTAANATFAANIVPSGGTASAANQVLVTRTIAPGEVYTCPELVGQSLESGMFISTLAGTAAALTITASGREIT